MGEGAGLQVNIREFKLSVVSDSCVFVRLACVMFREEQRKSGFSVYFLVDFLSVLNCVWLALG